MRGRCEFNLVLNLFFYLLFFFIFEVILIKDFRGEMFGF